jgi:predicted ester cyclase
VHPLRVSSANKDLVRRLYDAFSGGDSTVLDELFPSEFDTGEFRFYWDMFRQGFPDLHERIDMLVGEGDLVVARTYFEGTHTGEFMGLAPTGIRVQASSFGMYRIADGKIVEHWGEFDNLGLLQQIEAVPRLGPPAPDKH